MVYINSLVDVVRYLWSEFYNSSKKENNTEEEQKSIPSWEQTEKNIEYEQELYEFEVENRDTINPYKYYSIFGRRKETNLEKLFGDKEVRFYGYLTASKNKLEKLIARTSSSMAERVSILVFMVVSHVGYNSFKRIRAKDLQTVLGKGYKSILNHCEELKIFKVSRIPTNYNSKKREIYHTEISVVKSKAGFQSILIRDKKALNARKNYLQISDIDERNQDCYNLHLMNIFASTLEEKNEKSKRLNRAFRNCFAEQSIGDYGNRIYSFISNLKKEERRYVKPLHNIDAETAEVDISASQPLTWFSWIISPHLIIYAFKSKQITVLLSDIIYDIEFNDEMLINWEKAYYEGDFYIDFWANMLDEVYPIWEELILNTISKEDKEKIEEAKDRKRQLAKRSFMVIINSRIYFDEKNNAGTKPIIDAMEQSSVYSGLGVLIKELKSKVLNLKAICPNENLQLKKQYAPYKNLGIIITRIESYFMHEVYKKIDFWGLLIHDSILCEKGNLDKMKKAYNDVYLEYTNFIPQIKITRL